ncbi:hypothetical protein BLA29_000621, partial [Euroglyphus maynei]
MPQYRSNAYFYYQFKHFRQTIAHQSLLINKLFHLIKKKSFNVQISEESESYLAVLSLIARQK